MLPTALLLGDFNDACHAVIVRGAPRVGKPQLARQNSTAETDLHPALTGGIRQRSAAAYNSDSPPSNEESPLTKTLALLQHGITS